MPVDLLAHIFNTRLPMVRPATVLADIIEGYYHVSWDGREEDVWASLDGSPVLVFMLSEPFSLHFRGVHNRVFNKAFFCCYGLRGTYISDMPKGMRLLVVRFTSSGLFQLMQQPLPTSMPAALCGIGEIWGKAGEMLAEAICQDPESCLAGLEAFLMSRLPEYTTVNYKLQSAVQMISDQRGQLSVSDICVSLRVNYKWLERNFMQWLGVTPKAYLGNMRFLYAYFGMMNGKMGLTGIALESGYYDQNHFIRDCRKYTGRAPSQITSLYQQEQPGL
ncbi:helix-turn-helix domain-containing protein [Chitinophaga pinensis]|uniref:Helix-turn-helix transcriptional regulator n=1 Tax=Chitinophaga pinensis TaxID=79329 RepID=A0A5C6M431_9BACT|nr:helix-turn-helix transcriptional regulator [Chitinophaga pinensis]TWW02526.1 helix-turn-helix transcriptional regulator [Chitinophaga pinensis]